MVCIFSSYVCGEGGGASVIDTYPRHFFVPIKRRAEKRLVHTYLVCYVYFICGVKIGPFECRCVH